MAPKLTEKERNRQMKKEAIISIAMYVGFFVWWYFTGYGVAEKGTPETYTYVLGLPMWFFLSSIVGYILFSIATIIVVRLCFKNFDLGPALDEEENLHGDLCDGEIAGGELCQSQQQRSLQHQSEQQSSLEHQDGQHQSGEIQDEQHRGGTTSLLENGEKCQKGRAE